MNAATEEVLNLASRQIEDRLHEADQLRLQELLRSDAELVSIYTDYLCLHAQMSWDAGLTVAAESSPAEATTETEQPIGTTGLLIDHPAGNRRRISTALFATAAALVLILGVISNRPGSEPQPVVVDTNNDKATEVVPEPPIASEGQENFQPIRMAHQTNDADVAVTRDEQLPNDNATEPAVDTLLAEDFSDDDVIVRLDKLLEQSWQQHDVQPGPVATDEEWLRRTYLTFAGRIPTVQETEQFLQEQGPRKKSRVLNSLLDDPERSDNFATIWTNLMIGRTEKRTVNRDLLFDFMADQFDRNEPWIDTVGELITATGRNDENGATNFLLAHLNNQATPATAVTARLFLGEQISCVQCHDHPFSKSIRQEDYWALNAFFKDTVRIQEQPANSNNSRYLTCRLVDRASVERITHFETLTGQQKAVLPTYDGTVIPRESPQNRREVLADLLQRDSNTRIARAMVNRMWAHFFGYGFTNPIDDMGPHSVVSHPEILDLLTEAFVRSDYDLKRLTFWITASRGWQLGSQLAKNSADVPEHGEVPLFTRVYPRRMTPEQVYESVRVAIRSSAGQPLDHTAETLEHRQRWVQQFAEDYQTDENDESLNFGGTISQALVMMNGEEVEKAVRQAAQAIVGSAGSRRSTDQLLETVALAALTRPPTQAEQTAFRTHLRQLSRRPTSPAVAQAVEDMLWAYLNSSEFVLVH